MPDLLFAILFGFGLGLSLAAPPGPVLAFGMNRAARHGFWPGIFVPFGAILADGTHAALVGFGIVPLVRGIPGLLSALTLFGAALMLYFAYSAIRTARAPVEGKNGLPATVRRHGLVLGGLLAGYVLAITSPMNLAWWVGVGTRLFADLGIAVFAGFFGALVLYSFLFTGLVILARERATRSLPYFSYASAAIFVAFAAYLAYIVASGG